MRLRDYRFTILLVVLVGCVGCNQDESYDWGDPISIPDHPAFIWNAGPDANTITILDLDKEEIVGRRQVLPSRSWSMDFAVQDKHELFFGLDYAKVDTELGEEITIIDPSLQDQKIGEIKTYPSPAGIYPLSDGRAFVRHAFCSCQDTAWTTTLIDMNSKKALKEFQLRHMIDNVIELADGRVYLFYTIPLSTPETWMREFYRTTNTLGEEIELGTIGFGPHLAVVVDDSLICAPGDWVEAEKTFKSIWIVGIPSCTKVASIPLTEKTIYPNMTYVKNKLYVCHNTGEIMEHGNYNKVSVIDLESKTVTKVLTVCNAPCDIAYSAATNKIVVISAVGTVITIIDPQTDSVINTIVSDEVGDVDDEWGYTKLRIPE